MICAFNLQTVMKQKTCDDSFTIWRYFSGYLEKLI